MADVYITQYARLADGERGFIQTGEEPNLGTQVVTIGLASAQSAALHADTRFVRVYAEAACSVQMGQDPTAAKATDLRLAANGEIWLGIPKSLAAAGCKVAVIE